ncbi:MAG: hypothetical protein ACQZ3M_07360 [cyanobacterium endosymbiont of Rhopalodia fuxianensis]
MGEATKSCSDYVSKKDDEALVIRVAEALNTLGDFSYSHYQQNQDQHPAFPIINGESGVLISTETMEKNKHQPLSQHLLVYVFLTKHNIIGL